MDIRVTSAARKSQRAEDVPAAIYVITGSDIRQSGLMTLPEILRLAPGVQVAQVSAGRWAVSIRGFNDIYSNKLLVLMDGRSVYTRSFSGVLWDMQDVMASDIERIEIIRGPGGVAWGANAVNGVVNIISRPALETQGLALDASVGTFASERVGVRYGGTVGSAAYRVFSQWSGYADAWPAERARFADHWHSLTSGARVDWTRRSDAVLVQGHFTTNQTRAGWLTLPSFLPDVAPVTDGVTRGDEASVVGRWTRTWTSGRLFQVQAYHTATRRNEPVARFSENSSDVDAQYETRLGSRHGLVFGGGYRHVNVTGEDTFTVQLGSNRLETFNMFVQPEIVVRRGLAVTLGSKVEYDTFGGWGLLPSARVMWEVSPDQRLWVAASRARRTPSISDRDFRFNLAVQPGPPLPVVVAVIGDPAYRSERLVQLEAGHRIQLGATAAFDATVFSGSYDGLPTSEPVEPRLELTPGPPHVLAGITLANLLNARMNGVEFTARWNPLKPWKIETSYSYLHLTTKVDPASQDPAASTTDSNAPKHQWEAKTVYALRPGVEVGASIWRVGKLERLQVPAYTRLDARAEFRLNGRMTAAVVAQNLLHAHHQEFGSESAFLTSRIPRSARLDLRWEF
jgi:iron complex outermembrane receptor protein